MLESKFLANSVISDAHKGAHFMSTDLRDHFLHTPMKISNFSKVHYSHIPEDIDYKYKLDTTIISDGYNYMQINKAVYDLKQAAIITYNHIKANLIERLLTNNDNNSWHLKSVPFLC